MPIQSRKNFLSDIEHTLDPVPSAAISGLNYAVNYDRNHIAGAYLPEFVLYNQKNPYTKRIVYKGKSFVSTSAVTQVKTTCSNLTSLNSCCNKASWYYSCPQVQTNRICVLNQSNGAYVCLPVSYAKAFNECKYINQSVNLGFKSQFASNFSNSFR